MPPTISGVPSDAAAFVIASGGDAPRLVTSRREFEQYFESSGAPLARAFFDQGGRRLYVSPMSSSTTFQSALARLEAYPEIAMVAAPGLSQDLSVADTLIRYAEKLRFPFALLDSAQGETPEQVLVRRRHFNSSRAALYYPWVRTRDGQLLPPSAFAAGIFAATELVKGVHKSPANAAVIGAAGLEPPLDKSTLDKLSPEGVNCLRAVPARGHLLWGARTLTSNSLWKYIAVRRLFNFVERSINEGTQWAVFEPNGEALWSGIRLTVRHFLRSVWLSGALTGTKEDEAFFVKCDRTVMSEDDLANGRLVFLVGLAPLKPAEFIILRFAVKMEDD